MTKFRAFSNAETKWRKRENGLPHAMLKHENSDPRVTPLQLDAHFSRYHAINHFIGYTMRQ